MNVNDKVLVTGATGMSGSSIVTALGKSGFNNILTPTRAELDYTRKFCVQEYFDEHEPDVVFHCAGYISSHISHLRVSQSDLLIEDTYVNFNVVKAATSVGVRKLVAVGSCWGYDAGSNISETSWQPGSGVHLGVGHDTAKLAVITALHLLRKETGFDSTVLMIPPLYNSNVSDNTSDRHVVANIANAIYNAAKNKHSAVTLNGCATNQRQLVHTDDFSSAALLALDNDAPLLNVAYPETITMLELATSICEYYNYSGELAWSNDRPLGNGAATNPGPQDLDVSLANSFGWKPAISMHEGVQSFNVL